MHHKKPVRIYVNLADCYYIVSKVFSGCCQYQLTEEGNDGIQNSMLFIACILSFLRLFVLLDVIVSYSRSY